MNDRRSVEKILSEAREAVDAAEIPDDLRPLAFERALDLLGGPIADRSDSRGELQQEQNGSGNGRLDKIAKKLGIDSKTAEYFFDPDPEDVTLVVPRSKLAPSKSTATRQVALLYCSARQAGGYDETHTSVTNIRSKVENVGVLDPPNFSAHLKDIEGLSIRGSGQSREFKVTSHGYEEAAKIVIQIKGGAS